MAQIHQIELSNIHHYMERLELMYFKNFQTKVAFKCSKLGIIHCKMPCEEETKI